MSGPRDTERVHPDAPRLDALPADAWLEAMHADTARVLDAVRAALPAVAALSDRAAAVLAAGGRLVLAGAGTSGRLAALEAAECPPTFGTDPARIVALLAGGHHALSRAVEGVEDDAGAGARDLAALAVGAADLVVALSASGSTPYARGVIAEGRRRGATTAAIVCNAGAPLAAAADLAVTLATGPEFVAGSTRLKAATAQKLALNLVTTGAMRQLGRVRAGRMVALRATNAKLRARAVGIVADLAGLDAVAAARALDVAGGDVARALAALASATDDRQHPPPPIAANIAVRDLAPADAEAVSALAAEPSVVATTAPFAALGGVGLFRAWLARPGWMLGAWDAGVLAGVILIERRGALLREHVADVTFVAVSETARGLGVGDRLVAGALARAIAAGLTRVELRVWPANIAAIRLYARHGFAVEGRLRAHARVDGRYVDALLMAWTAPGIASFDGLE